MPAVVILGLSKGGFAGIGMASTPLVALVAGPANAAGVLLPILVTQDAVAVVMYRGSWNREVVRTMVPGAAAGVTLAYLFASHVPANALEVVLGVISVGFAVQQLLQETKTISAPAPRPRRSLGVVSGVASGFTSAIAHAGTPPFQFYVLPLRLEKEQYIGTSVMFFACTNLLKIPPFLALGQLTAENLEIAATLLPLALISSWLGVRLVRLVDPLKFRIAIHAVLVAVGIGLIAQGWLVPYAH